MEALKNQKAYAEKSISYRGKWGWGDEVVFV